MQQNCRFIIYSLTTCVFMNYGYIYPTVNSKVQSSCKIRYSQSSVTEDSSLLACYAVWTGKQTDFPRDGSPRSVAWTIWPCSWRHKGLSKRRQLITGRQVLLSSQMISCQQVALFYHYKSEITSTFSYKQIPELFCYERCLFFVSLVCTTFSSSFIRSHTKLMHLALASSQCGCAQKRNIQYAGPGVGK